MSSRTTQITKPHVQSGAFPSAAAITSKRAINVKIKGTDSMADTSTAAKATTAPGDQGQPESAPLAHEEPAFTKAQMIGAAEYIESYYGLTGMSAIAKMLRQAAQQTPAETRKAVPCEGPFDGCSTWDDEGCHCALKAAPPAQPHPAQGAEGSRVIALLEKTHDVVFSVRNDAANDAADLYERQDYEPAKRLSATAIQLEPAVDALESVLALLRASQPPPEALRKKPMTDTLTALIVEMMVEARERFDFDPHDRIAKRLDYFARKFEEAGALSASPAPHTERTE